MSTNTPLLKGEDVIRSPRGVLLWPWVFDKDRMNDKFRVTMILDPNDPSFDAFAAAVRAFARKAIEAGMPKEATFCLSTGEKYLETHEKVPEVIAGMMVGNYVLAASTKFDVNVYARKGGHFVALTRDNRNEIYSGCEGAIIGKLEAWKGRYSSVVFRLFDVAKLAEGERLGGRDPDKAFAGLADEADDTVGQAKTAGPASDLDDEILF